MRIGKIFFVVYRFEEIFLIFRSEIFRTLYRKRNHLMPVALQYLLDIEVVTLGTTRNEISVVDECDFHN